MSFLAGDATWTRLRFANNEQRSGDLDQTALIYAELYDLSEMVES